MSNKIYFKNASQETINIINYGLELIFVKAVVGDEIRSARKDLKDKQSKLDSESKECKDIEKQLNVLSDKFKNLNAYVKVRLFGDKDTIGVFDKIGFSNDFVTAYQNMTITGNVAAFRKYIRVNILHDIFGMDISDKPANKLAERLSVSIGMKNTSSSDVRDGKLIVRQKDNPAKEIAFKSFAEYISASNEGVNILKESIWSVQVDYDQNWKVTGYKITNKMTEVESDDTEASSDDEIEE